MTEALRERDLYSSSAVSSSSGRTNVFFIQIFFGSPKSKYRAQNVSETKTIQNANFIIHDFHILVNPLSSVAQISPFSTKQQKKGSGLAPEPFVEYQFEGLPSSRG